jgi:hypothetical protein
MNDDDRRQAEDRLTDLLTAGMEYQARGWYVFAAGPDKRPARNCGTAACRNHALPSEMRACPCLTCHGAYAATLDGGTLARQLEHVAGMELEDGRVPEATLALACGEISGVLVVDFDPTPERTLTSLIGQASPFLRGTQTVMARTPRGGLHAYYAYPVDGTRVGNSVGLLAPGIDVRSDGGFVVLPPSAGRRWMDGWAPDEHPLVEAPRRLVEKLNRPRVDRPAPKPWETKRGHLKSLCAFVERSPEGERNNSLFWAASRAREEVEAGLYSAETATIFLCESADKAGLSPREALTLVNRALRVGNE